MTVKKGLKQPLRRTGLRSMTGYGRGEASAGGYSATAEISSVNRRQLDVRLNLPRGMAMREAHFIECVRRRIARGHVQAAVTIERNAAAAECAARTDRATARAWIAELRAAAAELGLADDLRASHLLRLPGVLPDNTEGDPPPEAREVALLAFERALDGVCAMRAEEGARLRSDIDRRLELLAKSLDGIEALAPRAAAAWRDLLRRRLEDAGQVNAADDEIMRRELLAFAVRADITEEITRLRSHFEQASGFLNSEEPVGRAYDFLLQEMGREINTIGSKAMDAGISRVVVDFKTELERVREQIQNLE